LVKLAIFQDFLDQFKLYKQEESAQQTSFSYNITNSKQEVNIVKAIKLTTTTTMEILPLFLFLGVMLFLQEEGKVLEELELFSL